jgi:hypothetical protein
MTPRRCTFRQSRTAHIRLRAKAETYVEHDRQSIAVTAATLKERSNSVLPHLRRTTAARGSGHPRTINHRRTVHATAGRRPPRKRVAHDGKADKSVQRDARSQNPRRVPELITDVKRLYIQAPTDAPDCVPLTSRKDNKSAVKAISLVHKIANGSSADAMVPVFGDLIERGFPFLARHIRTR